MEEAMEEKICFWILSVLKAKNAKDIKEWTMLEYWIQVDVKSGL